MPRKTKAKATPARRPRKAAPAETLLQSEVRFAAFMDNLPGYAWMKDLEGRYVYVNHAVKGLPGYQSLGKTDTQIWPADLAAQYRANDREVVEGKKPIHTIEHFPYGGKQRWMAGSKFPIFDKKGSVALVGGAGVDITERIEAEEALRVIIDSIPVMAWTADPDGRVDFLNCTWLEYSGVTMSQAVERPGGTIHPDDHARVLARWREAFANGRPYDDEMRLRRADGQYRWFLVRTVPFRGAGRNILKWYGTSTDIEDRKRAEEALTNSLRLLREAQELGQTGGWEHDLTTGRISNTEQNARLFFGTASANAERFEDFAGAVHPDDRAYVKQRHMQLLAEDGPHEIEYRVVWPNGEVHVLRGLATVVRDDSGRPVRVYGTNLDITERRRKDEAIRTSTQRLRALTRRLVELQETQRRDISRELHDRVGQTLTAMRINMEIIRDRLGSRDDSVIRERNGDSLTLMASAFEAIKNVMYELRPPMLDEQGLIAPLQWYAKKFADRTGIRLTVTGDEGVRWRPEVELALFRIAQEAITNIARHARAASARIDVRRAADAAILTIEDDGVGISEAGRMEPPGYGMISMRERAESVDGTIEVSPRAPHGTRITVSVPVSAEIELQH
ncbi:MAG: PAS domain-containing protein [Usitatibacter sp.]